MWGTKNIFIHSCLFALQYSSARIDKVLKVAALSDLVKVCKLPNKADRYAVWIVAAIPQSATIHIAAPQVSAKEKYRRATHYLAVKVLPALAID